MKISVVAKMCCMNLYANDFVMYCADVQSALLRIMY